LAEVAPPPAQAPKAVDPTQLSTREIAALRLSAEDWRELLAREKLGKKRSTVLRLAERMLKQGGNEGEAT